VDHYFRLIPIGFLIGAYGTLIGAGGGFVLVPILLLLYPNEGPEVITSISLAVVFFNAASGSLAYARMKRIDYRSGLLFSAATIPGAIFGALTTEYIPRRPFDVILGVVMIATSAVLIVRPKRFAPLARIPHRGMRRRLFEADGTEHGFTYNPSLGVGVSAVVGYFSSVLGFGGGRAQERG
jgi:uncharacterized membrane protein YfcA